MADNISFKLTGTPIANATLPNTLRPITRAAEGAKADEFLPDGYLKVTAAFDVAQRSRSTAAA